MAERILSDWLGYYIDYASNSESPETYHFWTGVSILAGAVKRQIYLPWGHEKIYPNMYIILVGPSGKTRKGTAINIGRNLYDAVGLPSTPDSITYEQLVRAIGNTHSEFIDEITGEKREQSATTTFSMELAVFLGQKINNTKFLAALTDWYDSRDRWERETVGRGEDYIYGVCYNLLGATAPDWIQSILPMEAVGGGFTSRVIFVVETKKGRSIPLPRVSKEQKDLEKYLLHDLNMIQRMTGPVVMTAEALEAYKDWYTQEEKDSDNELYAIVDPRFRGYCERRSTHLRKLCMILSVSGGASRDITLQDFHQAKAALERIEPQMPLVFGGLGASANGEVIHSILMHLKTRKTATRSEMLQHFYRDVGSTALFDIVVDMLAQMKKISVTRDFVTKDTNYNYLD